MNPLLAVRAAQVENFLGECFLDTAIPPRLADAMRYSLLAGGKRLRPALCLASALAVNHSLSPTPIADPRADAPQIPPHTLTNAVMPFAAALEMIHTYSLIHDDLPAMDDDDTRRGCPSCHKAFDEGTAILAGDALLTDAFGFMTRAQTDIPAARVLEAVRLAAEAAGASGMVGGQILDLAAEGHVLDLNALLTLNAKKTGALLRCACECGAVLAGAAPATRAAIRLYGEELGIAFQITDDILDVIGNPNLLGKPVGSDANHQKATWPALLGLDAARQRAMGHCQAAITAITHLSGPNADMLRNIASDMMERES